MTIGLLHMEMTIQGARSLKDKRRAMNSLKTRLRNRFNCSVSEVGFKDKWGCSQLAVFVVSDESAHVDDNYRKSFDFLQPII